VGRGFNNKYLAKRKKGERRILARIHKVKMRAMRQMKFVMDQSAFLSPPFRFGPLAKI